MRADLHLHSYYSDGSEAPATVVEEARAGELELIALTDHDSLGGLTEAQAATERCGLRLIPAVEFTATLHSEEVHLLGYFPAPPGGEVDTHLARMQAARRERLQGAIEGLRRRGIEVRFEDLPCAPCCQSVTTAHLAILLAGRGYASSARAAWRKFLGAERGIVPAFTVTAEEVIGVIHAGGGLAVWAHPGRRRFKARLEELAGMGLDGLEAANYRRGLDSAGQLQAMARQHNLVATGGSDWHGGTRLGEFAAGEDLLGDFLARLGVTARARSS